MKMIIIGAAFGLTATTAMAECAGHMPITAEANVDRTIVTASVTPTGMTQAPDILLLKKSGRLPEETSDTPKTE